MVRGFVALTAITVAVTCFAGGAWTHPGKLHIHELRATVSTANGVQWVNVRAQVCLRSAAEAGRYAPDELGLTQYIVFKGRWRPTRVVNDPADWVVAIGENWGNRACGSVTYRDVFDRPEGFAGFGSSANCIGVAFSITVNTSRATKRTTIRCGSRR
jgi:hypothetical protein